MITMRGVTILGFERKEDVDTETFGRVAFLFTAKLMNTTEQHNGNNLWMGQNEKKRSRCASWFKWCFGTRTRFYIFGRKLYAHKFDQLHRIPINWYLYAVAWCVQQNQASWKNLQRHHFPSLCAFIVLKCHFAILFINCVRVCVCAPEICLHPWTNNTLTCHYFYARRECVNGRNCVFVCDTLWNFDFI